MAFCFRISGDTSGLMSSGVEVREPAVGRDERVVAAEQHPIAQAACSRSGRAAAGSTSATIRRGRSTPAACASRSRSPRPATGRNGWARTILSVGEVHGDVVDVDRVGVLQPDAAAPGEARADARVARVEERRQPCLLDHLVERVRHAVVREEALDVRVELEAAHAVVGDQAAALRRRRGAPCADRCSRTGSGRRRSPARRRRSPRSAPASARSSPRRRP